MRVAIVHDYLVNRGGAERVVEAMRHLWPDAPVFTSIYHPEDTYPSFREADVRTSFLQRWSRDAEGFRRFLPLFPRAFRYFDLSGYDVVVSSSSGFAHHVRVPQGTCHVVYSYSPPRFLWDPRYDTDGMVPRWARPALPPVRAWLRRRDRKAARAPHFYLAVSAVAKRCLEATYGRQSMALQPPIDLGRFSVGRGAGDYHLMVGRMLPYRNQHLAVRAFTEMERRLVVVGDGPARANLERLAGPTIEFRGVVADEELLALYRRCRGVIVTGEEDFGLIPLEANACGRPAIAFGAGGALETVVDGVTGVLFRRPTPGAIAEAVERAERAGFEPALLRAHAERFGIEAFCARLARFVEVSVSSCIECRRRRLPRIRPQDAIPAAEEA